ncbi:hypothetical protein HN873_050358 [Arachis hypogaea]|nr:uncharacterized protein DS421_15g490610 [Arachis hypogaea]
MAHYLSTGTCLLFLVLILSHDVVLFSEGRTVRKSSAPPDAVSEKSNSSNLHGYVEAFRPTAPGHSPGVGHSINN